MLAGIQKLLQFLLRQSSQTVDHGANGQPAGRFGLPRYCLPRKCRPIEASATPTIWIVATSLPQPVSQFASWRLKSRSNEND
jgi:hypothetical protein